MSLSNSSFAVTITPRRRPQNRINYEESPPPSTQVPSEQLILGPASQGDGFYQIRDIIDERRDKYKVDWADHPRTGEKYSPTWVPKSYVTSDAISEWEEQKRIIDRDRRKATARRVIPTSSESLKELKSLRRAAPDVISSQEFPSSSPLNRQEVAVILSQHSSFPREEYPHHQAVTSSPRVVSSELQSLTYSGQPASSLPGGPFSTPDSLRGIRSSQPVPDSQPMENSLSADVAMAATAEAPSQYPRLSQEQPSTPLSSGPNVPIMHDRVAELASEDAPMVLNPPTMARSPSMIPAPTINEPVGNSRLFPDDTGVIDEDFAGEVPQLSTHVSDDDDYDATLAVLEDAPTSITLDELQPPKLPAREYMVSLQLPGRLKDDYYKILANGQDEIRALYKAKILDEKIAQDARSLIAALNNLCTHPDLNDTTAINQSEREGDNQFRSWSEQMSTKFAFLKKLCETLQYEEKQIVLVCHSGTVVRFLQRFLALLKVRRQGPTIYDREESGANTSLQVTIYCSDREHDAVQLPAADLILAFDSSFDADNAAIKACRQGGEVGGSFHGQLSPVVYPFVYASPEHIRLCCPPKIKVEHRLKAMMHLIMQTRKKAGELEPFEASAVAAGEEVGEWILDGATRMWTIHTVQPVPLKGIELVPASQSSSHGLGSQGPSNGVQNLAAHRANGLIRPGSRAATPISRKRALDADPIGVPGSPQKRARPDPNDGEMSRTDASLLANNSMPSSTQSQIEELQHELANTQAALEDMQSSSSSTAASLKVNIKQHQESLNELFTKYDRMKEKLRDAKDTIEELEKLKQRLEDSLQKERDTNTKLRANEAELMDAIKGDTVSATTEVEIGNEGEAGTNNADGAAPSSAETDKAMTTKTTGNATAVLLRQENKNLKNKVKTLQSELDFVRTQYQQRDSDLGNAQKEQREAEEESRQLRARLENVRATQAGAKEAGDSTRNEIKFLRAQVKALETTISNGGARKEQRPERGRGMNTRSGSAAPRSPRFAGAAGLAPGNGNGRDTGGGSPVAGSRVASRGGSPARREGVAGRRGRTLQALE